MRGIRKTGFTLIELLVVIAIIALLLGILMPNIMAAREEARRAACSSNCSGIVKAIHIYADQFKGFLPAHVDDDDRSNSVGYNYDVEGNADDGPVHSASCSRAYFILVKLTYTSIDLFRCPSDKEVDTDTYDTSDIGDFKPSEGEAPISYSMQVNKVVMSGDTWDTHTITNSADAALALVSDQNGFSEWRSLTDDRAQAFEDTDATSKAQGGDEKAGNTSNHEWAGERNGQSVAYLGGYTKWQETFRCGVEGDNIWTEQTDRDDEGDPDPDGFGTYSVQAFPDNDLDSVLMP